MIESIEGEEKELQLLQEIAMNSSRMAEACEAMREMSRTMMECLDVQGNRYFGNEVRQGRMSNGPTQPRPPVICYRCQRPGHIRRICRSQLEGPSGNQRQKQGDQNFFGGQPVPLTREPNPYGPRRNGAE